MDSVTSSLGVHSATDSLEEQAAARVAAAVCGKRVVLLGELPDHGHARGFGVKARVVERLVANCGFRAVLFEAGSYDFFGLERAIATTPRGPAGAGRADSLQLALDRAIGGFWWTRELAGWRRWLVHEAAAGRVAIGGLDDQPSATAAYARAIMPGMVGAAVPPARSAECREAVARYFRWGYTEALPYDSTEQARLADCSRLAADRGPAAPASAAGRTPDEIMLTDLATYFARERRAAGAPDRDRVMAQRLAWWSARLPQDARIVVWTATVHAARAPGPNRVLPGRSVGRPAGGHRLHGARGGVVPGGGADQAARPAAAALAGGPGARRRRRRPCGMGLAGPGGAPLARPGAVAALRPCYDGRLVRRLRRRRGDPRRGRSDVGAAAVERPSPPEQRIMSHAAPEGLPAVKDLDAAHPIARAWRPMLCEVVRRFVEGDYQLAQAVPGVEPVSAATAEQVRDYVAGYGATLVELPDDTWQTSVAQWMETHWDILVDFWTAEEGRSDLVLEGKVVETSAGPRLTIHMVYVP